MARDIGDWLEEQGLGIYADAFAENEIDFGALRHLGEADLKELGLPMGPRKKLLAAISEFETDERSSADAGVPELTHREAERRQVTVLFADMEAYTSIAEQIGEEKVYSLMERVLGLTTKIVADHNGTVRNFTGDGIMALFGWPTAREDGALHACRAALSIQERMIPLAGELDAECGVRPRLRIGLNSGSAVIGDLSDKAALGVTALGDTVNLAQRVETLAEPGRVALSEGTYRQVSGYVDATPAGTHEIKGKRNQQPIYRLDRIRSGVTRFDVSQERGLTRFVERERELETLEQLWQEASGGELRIAHVVGEAGVGKSRLVHEAMTQIGTTDAFVLRGHCTADGHANPFHPFVEVIRTSFDIGEHAERKEIEAKLRHGLGLLDLNPDDALPFLLDLLGQSADETLGRLELGAIAARTRETLSALLRERCRLSPVVLFIEDVHWIDSGSTEILGRILDSPPPGSLFVVLAYRPPFIPYQPHSADVTQIRLEPLTRHGTIALLNERFSVEGMPEEVVRRVADKCEGNPLFAEEIANYLSGVGLLERGAGLARLQDGDFELPASLESVLVERVDHLDTETRGVLEAASIIGQRFSPDVLRHVLRVDGDLTEHLISLEENDLVFRETRQGLYRFKHALLRDTIQKNMLAPKREDLHKRTGEALEVLYAERLGEVADALAHHFSHTPCSEKAVRYLALAGQRSLRLHSLDEADKRLRQAVRLVETMPDFSDDEMLMEIFWTWMEVHQHRSDFVGSIERIAPYLAHLGRKGDRLGQTRLAYWEGFAYSMDGQGHKAKPIHERGIMIGEELGDARCIAYHTSGLAYVHLVDQREQSLDVVKRLCDRVSEFSSGMDDLYLTDVNLLCGCYRDLMRGRFAETWRATEGLLKLGRQTGDPRPLALGLYMRGYIELFRERYEAALDYADQAMRVALRPADRLHVRAIQGSVQVMTGEPEKGLETLQQITQVIDSGGFRSVHFMFDYFFGASLVLTGHFAEGVRSIEESIARFESWGQLQVPVVGRIVLGEIYLQMASGEDKPSARVMLQNIRFLLLNLPVAHRKAERHLTRAVAECRELDMPGFLARSLYNLGLLHRARKRLEKARSCFEEAREIADRVDAITVSLRAAEALRE